MIRTIIKAILVYKSNIEKKSYEDSLKKSQGLWKSRNIDGLDYVESLRDEWE